MVPTGQLGDRYGRGNTQPRLHVPNSRIRQDRNNRHRYNGFQGRCNFRHPQLRNGASVRGIQQTGTIDSLFPYRLLLFRPLPLMRPTTTFLLQRSRRKMKKTTVTSLTLQSSQPTRMLRLCCCWYVLHCCWDAGAVWMFVLFFFFFACFVMVYNKTF